MVKNNFVWPKLGEKKLRGPFSDPPPLYVDKHEHFTNPPPPYWLRGLCMTPSISLYKQTTYLMP